MSFIFHSVGNVIIPTDELIFFQRGRSTTNQIYTAYLEPSPIVRGHGAGAELPTGAGRMGESPRQPPRHRARGHHLGGFHQATRWHRYEGRKGKGWLESVGKSIDLSIYLAI